MRLHRLGDLVREEPLNRLGEALKATVNRESVTNIEALVALLITAVHTCSPNSAEEYCIISKLGFLEVCEGMWEAYGKCMREKSGE